MSAEENVTATEAARPWQHALVLVAHHIAHEFFVLT